MKKLIIAVDIDDVLANSHDALRIVVNKKLNVALEPEHYDIKGEYWSYYETVWRNHGLEGRVSMDELLLEMSKSQMHISPHMGAQEALKKLSKKYELIIVTSRKEEQKKATLQWLDNYFPGTFSKTFFAGGGQGKLEKTKGEICKENSAKYLIDDNVVHAKTAVENGVKVVLFGKYGWQQDTPANVVRCENWEAVMEYFNGRQR